jgi:SAM-dependent methyltransferase
LVDSIERRLETPDKPDPNYAGREMGDDASIARGAHRDFVGGANMWDRMGQLQLDYLKSVGLQPKHRLLDVGCGSLRAGLRLVDYLDPGNYYGIDINHSVLEAGYFHELTEAQRQRLPVANLRSTDRFDGDFGVQFDMAIAQSVFTHVSLNHMRLCLYRVAKVMAPGGKFYATFFERGEKFPLDGIPPKRPRYTERNIFWYYRSDLAWVAERSPWKMKYIGDWDHPRGQKMVEYTLASEPARSVVRRRRASTRKAN